MVLFLPTTKSYLYKGKRIINKAFDVVMIDLDGTLIDTDHANNLAYLEACKFYAPNLKIPPVKRITKKIIQGCCSDKELVNLISQMKIDCYSEFVNETYLNIDLYNLLLNFQQRYSLYLVTKASKHRALTLLKHHNCLAIFDDLFYCKENKYLESLETLNIKANKVLIFENEAIEIQQAIDSGIIQINIRKVIVNQRNCMYKYTIEKNEFLSRNVDAFYRCDYLRWNQPNNPDYLNILKNTYNDTPNYKLLCASNSVKEGLSREIDQVLLTLVGTDAVICVIPRSKKEHSYNVNQLLFRKSVNDIVDELLDVPFDFYKVKVINGIDSFKRYLDTCTTHLAGSRVGGGNGSMPYIGITHDTCKTSKLIEDKQVLLIDDIYTKNVNIVEDAIQYLLDNGASNVTFFSVARTPHYTLIDDNQWKPDNTIPF